MGKSWPRTEEQTAYLDGQLDALLEARQNETIKTFRDQLYEGWSKRWPEKAIVFPSWKDGDPPLTQEESDIVGKAIAKRKGVSFYASSSHQCLNAEISFISNFILMSAGAVQLNRFALRTPVLSLLDIFREPRRVRKVPVGERYSRSIVTFTMTRSSNTLSRRS